MNDIDTDDFPLRHPFSAGAFAFAVPQRLNGRTSLSRSCAARPTISCLDAFGRRSQARKELVVTTTEWCPQDQETIGKMWWLNGSNGLNGMNSL